MLRTTLKGLWSRKRRLLGTSLAVLIGAAFLSGTLALGDTLRRNFDSLFSEANEGIDAVVRNATMVGTEDTVGRGLIDERLVEVVRAVDGVAVAQPTVFGYGQLVDAEGDTIGGGGPPTLAGSWVDDAELNPYALAEGRAPQAPDEIVIDRGAAEDGGFRLGDTVTVRTPDPVRVRVVGIVTFGEEDSLAGVTYTGFTLEGAQRNVTKQPGRVSSIDVRAADGVAPEDLVARIAAVVPEGVEVRSGEQATAEAIESINEDFLDLFTRFLTMFAAIALLVATFSIYNTFAILVAQRTREAALLRAVGATQRQVLGSVVLEALVVGLVASVIGVLAGVAIALGLKAMLAGFGFGLPAGGLVFDGGTVVAGVLTGCVVTLAAGIFPALRAARTSPLAALRQSAAESPATSRIRAGTGIGITALGVAVVLVAVIAGSGSGALAQAAIGAVLTIIGLVVFGPVVARPVSRALGSALPRLRGITGSLARENAMRNPRRTSATAAALMVGVGVVTLFTVFAASLKQSIDDSVAEAFEGDLVVQEAGFGGGGFSPRLAGELAALPEVEAAAGLGYGAVRIAGKDRGYVTIGDAAALDAVAEFEVRAGSLADVGPDELAVSARMADDRGWSVGTVVPATFPDGFEARLRVAAIFEARDVVGNFIVPRPTWAAHAVQDIDQQVLVALRDGVPIDDGKAAVSRAVAAYGEPEVLDREEFVESFAGEVDQMLGLVYVMLALAILIALMGIANTLSLSIHERTQELGLLRAVGQTRRQTRSMVRWESVLIATFGTLGGVGVGVFLGWALVRAASEAEGIGSFAAPVGQLVTVLVVGALAGVVASLRPARRAARLDVLRAIAAD